MRNKTYCLEIGQGVKSLRGSDRGFDCRLTVVRPSADRRFRALKVLTVLLLILTVGVGNVFGDELTVGSGSNSTEYSPFYGNYVDQKQRNQIVYPVSDLSSMSVMEGKNITGIKFYQSNSNAWSGSFTISIAETSGTGFDSKVWFTDELTKVYEGTVTGGTEVTITFQTPYTYGGGNLLLDIQTKTTSSNYKTGTFKGNTNVTTKKPAAYAYNNNVSTPYATLWNLPQTTFTYEEAAAGGCAKPKALTQSAVSATSATFTWTAGGEETSWQWVCLPAATAVDWSSSAVQTANSVTATATGLSAETNYKFYVRADCGSEQSTEVSKSFTTTCAGASLPFTEDFEAVTTSIPNCWGRIAYSYYGTDYPYVYNSGGRSGKGLYFYGGASSSSSIIILPPFEVATNTLSLSFWYKSSVNASYGKLKVGYMTNPADASTFVVLPEGTLNQTSTWTEVQEFSLASAPASSFIAIQYSGGSSAYGTGYIDDISVSVASACKKPASLTATAASATSIDLSWTAKGEEAQWNVQYSSNGGSSWTSVNNISTTVDGTNCTATLTGLTAQTTYEIQVQANCGGEQSDWSASAEATTLCDAQTIPWNEDFEGMSNGSSSSPAPDCWTYLGLNGGTYPYAYPYAYNDGTKYYKGTRALFLVANSSADSYIILPAFDAPLNTLQLTFSHFEESVAQSGSLVVGYMTNITNASSFVAIDGGACTNADRTWTDEEISLASVPAGVASTARLVIKFTHASTQYYSAIDDITVSELPDCPKPVLTATNVIFNGATINWADGSSEKKWKLQYKAASDADWTDANGGALIEASSFALDGLTPGTAYQVKAQAECEGDWSNAVSFTPNYVTPTNFQLDAKSANSATISWTANSGESSWTVQYKKSSDGDWTTISSVTAKPYTITGLTSATTYQVKVAAGSFYTSAITFDTECESVTTFPWEENFESRTENTIVKCWDNSASTASGTNYYKWGVHTSGGNKMMRMCNYYVGQSGVTALINTPTFEIPNDGKEYELSFDYSHTATCGNFSIKVSTNNGESFSPIEGASYAKGSGTSYTAPGDFTNATISLADYSGQTIILQFFSNPNYGDGAIFVDNIKIAEKPACANPSKPAISETTASSAVVTWTSEASGFALQYRKGEGEWQNATGTIESPFTLSGLDEQSTYTVQVKAICGIGNESEFVASDAFTTNCAEKALGYEMAFGATLDACWDNSVYGFSSQWIISSESTNYYMRYATNTNTSCYGVLQTPAIIVPSDKETIARFQWQNTGATASVKVSVDGAEPEDVTTDLSNVTSGWVTKDISLSDYKGHIVVFYFRGQYNAAKNKYLYLDDFTVIEKPCETPTALAAVATSTGATITWTAGGDESQWNLRYREIAEPENAWTVVEDATTGYAITGLEVGHNYEVQVQAYCDATHQSDWTASANFTPVCGAAPTNLAVSARTTNSATLTWEGVESAFALQTSLDGEAWEDAINVNAVTYNLTGLTAGTTYYVRVQNHCGGEYATTSFTTRCGVRDAAELPLDITNFTAVPECWEVSFKGEYSGIAGGKICFYGAEEQWAILPAYDIDLNKLSVTFTYSLSGTADFGYLDEPNGTFHAFASQPTSGVELNLAGEATGAKYIAIRYNGSSSMLISGVQVRKTPTCNKPMGVTAVPSVGSATIDWTSDAEAWKLQYKTGTEDWTEVSVAGKPYEITGLTQGTNYKVRVQAACAGDELSDWSDEVDFTTSCSGIDAIPYYADFTETLSSCWIVSAQDESYYKPTVNTAMQQLTMNGGKEGASNNVVVMPPFSADLGNAVLSFEYNCSTGANYAQLEVGYVTDKADVASFVAVETLAKSSSWVEARVPATSFGGNYIAFRYAGGSSHGDLAIRNLRVINQLVLADEVDNSAAIAANNGQTLDIQIGRTITCTGYFNTICLPFSLPTLDGTPLEGAELWAFKYAKVENEELLFRIVEASSIEAGKPYFIQFAAGDPIENPLFKNVIISATAGQRIGDASVAQLCGILKPETFAPGDKTKLFLYNENALYWWNGTYESQLKSFRAYFYVNTTSGANYSPIRHGMIARIIKEEQTATGVDNVQGDNVQCIKMIENDQIVIIKNGVKYNVQGQVISK